MNRTTASIKSAALTLLFTTTYLWVAYNRVVAVDGRGLGWFSLFVAITVVPIAIEGLAGAQTFTDVMRATRGELGLAYGELQGRTAAAIRQRHGSLPPRCNATAA